MKQFGYDHVAATNLLNAANLFLGVGRLNWEAVNKPQTHFLERYLEDWRQITLAAFNVATKADTDYVALNSEMKTAGYDMQFQPFGPGSIGIFVDHTIRFNWLVPGKTEKRGRPIMVLGKPGFQLDKENQIETYELDGFGEDPLIRIPAQGGLLVEILPWRFQAAPVDSDWQLFEKAQKYTYEGHGRMYSEVNFPNVNFNIRPDVNWLRGLKNGGWFVAQAMAQIRMGMNHLGVAARSGMAAEFAKGLAMPPYVVDCPFLMRLWWPGFDKAPVMFYVTPDSFVESVDLDKI